MNRQTPKVDTFVWWQLTLLYCSLATAYNRAMASTAASALLWGSRLIQVN